MIGLMVYNKNGDPAKYFVSCALDRVQARLNDKAKKAFVPFTTDLAEALAEHGIQVERVEWVLTGNVYLVGEGGQSGDQ